MIRRIRHSGAGKGVLYSPQREPALYASLPAPSGQTRKGSGLQVQTGLLATLLAEHAPAKGPRSLALVRNGLGKPRLLVDGAPGPAVSFSWSAGEWWAALGTASSWIGLDAASPGEFAGAYPLNKVFSAAEWQAAVLLTEGDREETAALLWSVKEAVVKARGCGYHFFGPRQVRLEFAGPGEQGPYWRGCLEAGVADPVLRGGRETFPAVSVRLNQVWLSVAWMAAPPGNPPPLAE